MPSSVVGWTWRACRRLAEICLLGAILSVLLLELLVVNIIMKGEFGLGRVSVGAEGVEGRDVIA
jgi:hypothetical protein